MTWRERIREAAYTSPTGTRIRFDFEDVGRGITLRSTPFEFPGVDGAYIQQNGAGARRYPMRVIFSGDDHDLIATAFEAALEVPGLGRLEHPMYGLVPNVVPVGEITRRDDLKTAANQTIIEVEFWKTLIELFPQGRQHPRSEILAALDGFDVAAAQQFADSLDIAKVGDRASLKGTILKTLDEISDALGTLSTATSAVRREFADIQAIVNRGIDVFVGQPLLLAQQISNLIKAPSRALSGIRRRLAGYKDLADRIFGSGAGNPGDRLTAGVVLPLRTTKIANDFHVANLSAMNAVGGSVRSVVETRFETRPDAINSAIALVEQFDALASWRDDGFGALEQIEGAGQAQVDTGEAYQALRDAFAVAVGNLVEISFSLLPERRIVLDRARTIVDLSAELYGEVDARLDQLIDNNQLTGSEILELPAGRSIVYYPN